MKPHTALLLCLLLQTFPGAAWGADPVKEVKSAAAADAPTAKVGAMDSASRMLFEGNVTFAAERLYRGLHTNGDWLLAAHPEAPLADFVQVTQAALVRGYQRAGFPFAQVTQTRLLASPQRLLCVIEEGPRYTAGEVTVTGAQSVPAALIIEKLTTAPKKKRVDQFNQLMKTDKTSADAAVSLTTTTTIETTATVTTTTSAPSSTSTTTTKSSNATTSTDIPWKKGKPAALDARRIGDLEEIVLKQLAQAGRVQAKVEVKTVRDDVARTAALHVKIVSEGPAAVLDRITCTGLQRDSETLLLQYLGLAKGRPFLSGQVQEIEELLLRSARYTSFKVTATPRQADRPEMDLKLELVEMPEAPPLAEPLNATQKTLVKARDWINDLARTGSEDLLLTLYIQSKTGRSGELKMIYNPQRGLQMTLLLSDDAEGRKNPRRYLLRYAQEELTAFFSAHDGAASQWLRQSLSSTLMINLFVTADTTAPKDNRTSGTFNFGGSWKKREGNALLDLVLTMTPAAALLNSLKFADEWESRDGLLVMKNETADGEGKFGAVIDAATGRLRELGNGKGSWDTAHTVFGRFSITTAKGAWDQATQEMEAQTAGLANSYDASAGLASWSGWLTAAVLNCGFGQGATAPPEEIARSTAAAQDFGRRLGAAAPAFFSASTSDDASFFVPDTPDKPRTTQVSSAMIAQIGLYFADMLVDEGSWPWLLAREVYYSTTGRNEYTGRILQQVREDPQLGPVGCYMAATLLDGTLPAAAGDFRQLALKKMTAADFRQDWGLLVQYFPMRQRIVVADLMEKIRVGGQNAETDLLQEIFGAAEAGTKIRFNPILQSFLHELRSGPERPLATALTSAMDKMWDETLSGMLRERLTPKGSDGKPVDAARVAVLVGDTEVTRREMEIAVKVFRGKAPLAKPEATPEQLAAQQAELEQAALKAQIDLALLHAAFKAMGNTIKPEQLDADISAFVTKNYRGSQARFLQQLGREGYTLAEYRMIREKLLVASALRPKIKGMAPPPTEQEITRQVALVQAAHPPELQVQLHTLSITKPDTKQAEAQQRQLADDLHAKLKAGQDFEALARKFSTDSRAADGGARDWLSLSALSPAVAKLLAGMKPGDISEVADIGTTWIIVKLDAERTQSKTAEELRKEATAVLQKQKGAEFYDTWLNTMRVKIPVQIIPQPEPKPAK